MPKLKNLNPQQRELLLSNFIDHIGHECKVSIQWYEHGEKKEILLLLAMLLMALFHFMGRA